MHFPTENPPTGSVYYITINCSELDHNKSGRCLLICRQGADMQEARVQINACIVKFSRFCAPVTRIVRFLLWYVPLTCSHRFIGTPEHRNQ